MMGGTERQVSRTGPDDRPTATDAGHDDPPPPLGSWLRLYAAVLANLALLVALFYLFTKHFE